MEEKERSSSSRCKNEKTYNRNSNGGHHSSGMIARTVVITMENDGTDRVKGTESK